ncbi:MAG: hypothetical protein AAGJ38_02885 [Planctomycetota bacterium]
MKQLSFARMGEHSGLIKAGIYFFAICPLLSTAGCQTNVSEKHYFSRESKDGEKNYYRVQIDATSSWFDNVRYIAGDFDEQVVNEYFAGPITRESVSHTLHEDGTHTRIKQGKSETSNAEKEQEQNQGGSTSENNGDQPKKPDAPKPEDDDSSLPARIGRTGSVFLYIQSARANVIANEIKDIATSRVLGDQLAMIMNKDQILERAEATDQADNWKTTAQSLASTLNTAKENTPTDEAAVLAQARELLAEMGEIAVFTDLAGYRQWLADNRYRLMNGGTP